jgi:hypothetical protein
MGENIMAFREKDQADFDLETFVDLFDTAMSSDNPAVQKALKNLILISALVGANANHDIKQGPLRRLVEDIKHLNQRISSLEMNREYKTTYAPPSTGTWPSGTIPPGTIGTIPPGTIWTTNKSYTDPNNGAISAQGHMNQAKSFVNGHGDVFEVKVGALLDKLESK